MEKEIFYVRGLVCETTLTTVMVLAKDPEDARAKACEVSGVSGTLTVYTQKTFDGLQEGENFIMGFAS